MSQAARLRRTDLTCPSSPAHVVPAGKVLKFPLWRPREPQSTVFQQGREEPTLGTGHDGSLPTPGSCRLPRDGAAANGAPVSRGGPGCSIPAVRDFGRRQWKGVGELGVGGRCVSPGLSNPLLNLLHG